MRRKRGDRKDGKRIRDMDGIHFIMPYLMRERCESEVYIHETLDVTNLVRYIEEKNSSGAEYKTTAFHVIATALGKTIFHRPLLNRFIAGRRYYMRNDITLAFVVKRKFEDESHESLLITKVDGDTTLEKMSRRIIGDAEQVRNADGNDIDAFLNKLSKLPRCVMRAVMAGFRFLDFHGMMPAGICDGDSNYATVLITNLGSIKCDAVYHHLNNYGTNSIIIAIGKIHKATLVNDEGEHEIRDVVNIGATVDERISDGFYFAKSIRLLEKILLEPEKLEMPIKEEF